MLPSFDIFRSIYFRYPIVVVRGESIFDIIEAIEFSFFFGSGDIAGQIKVPPRAIIKDAIPSVKPCVFVRGSINCIAGDVLTTAEYGEKM